MARKNGHFGQHRRDDANDSRSTAAGLVQVYIFYCGTVIDTSTYVWPLAAIPNSMRRKRFQGKVRKCHQRLGPGQLYGRPCRHRDDGPFHTRDYAAPQNDGLFDEYAFENEQNPDNLRGQRLNQCLADIIYPAPPLFCPEWATDAGSNYESTQNLETAATSPDRLRSTGVAIEDRLMKYVASVVAASDNTTMLQSLIAEYIDDPRDLVMLRSLATEMQEPCLARWMGLFAPFWVRSPQTWRRGSEISLLNHLFVLYEVPTFLYSQWFRNDHFPEFKWLCWFILLGQGGSLKRAAKLFNWNISGGFQHCLREVPPEALTRDACIIAELKGLGGTEIDVGRILPYVRCFLPDLTNPAYGNTQLGFWRDTMRWLIAHSEALNDQQSHQVLAWAIHELTEVAHDREPTFSLKGRRLDEVLRRSADYGRQCERTRPHPPWRSHGWDWVLNDAAGGRWSFVELTSAEDLVRRGAEMRHCVAGYASRCASGNSAIVSVRFNDARCITVEINPKTKQVVQARGQFNRPASAKEHRAISTWMNAAVRPDASRRPNLRCRRCRRPIHASEALYFDRNNNRTKYPACPRCHEGIVRRNVPPGVRSFAEAWQRAPGTADWEYHGEHAD